MEILQAKDREERWVDAEDYPEVRFKIESLTHAMTSNLIMKDVELFNLNLVGLGLKGIEGMTDSGKPWALSFTKKKIGKNTYQMVKHSCLEDIPSPIFNQILRELGGSNKPDAEEDEAVNFTAVSSPDAGQNAPTATEN